MRSRKILKALKTKVRKEFIEQGGQDGRFATKVVPDKKKNTDSRRLNNVLQREFGTMHGDAHVYIMRGEYIKGNADHESNHGVCHDILEKSGYNDPSDIDN